jgi:hypothetical protein
MKPHDLPTQLVPTTGDRLQQGYADRLAHWTRFGQLLLTAAFVACVFGALPIELGFDRLPRLWSQPLPIFVAAAHWPTGWQWLAMPLRGDAVCLLAIAVLCSGAPLCLLATVPAFLRQGQRTQALFCVAIVATPLLAATGFPPPRL